ncbi:hypothetical protein Ancab_011338 [Ancistrocladus abbreviatus]
MEAAAAEGENWSEKVEDLIESGDIDAAISLLEALTLKRKTSVSEHQLASALFELADLYASKGLSLKADDTRSRAAVLKNRSLHSLSPHFSDNLEISTKEAKEVRVSAADDLAQSASTVDSSVNDGVSDLCSKSSNDNAFREGSPDDDWEAIADELLAPQSLPGVSKLSLEDHEERIPNRRGRGHFSYRKHGLYSDQQSDEPFIYDPEDMTTQNKTEENSDGRNSYGTRHVLVLDGFQPSTTTTDLEKLFKNFMDQGFAIRWVNDTVALAVFRTPSLALEAFKNTQCTFSVRVLVEDDMILSSIPPKGTFVVSILFVLGTSWKAGSAYTFRKFSS